ncbi:MAG: hypothetical protein LUC48_08180 [Clostridiales bacterium]|nr:hypothetical protein [Clostridiales bacterium]
MLELFSSPEKAAKKAAYSRKKVQTANRTAGRQALPRRETPGFPSAARPVERRKV